MARTVDFLPEIFRTPTNKQVLHATLDQLVQEPAYERAQGFIGRRYGPGVTTEDRYIVEPSKTRRDYQLEPAAIFLEDGNRRVIDALTYPGYLDALKQLNGPVTRPDQLFEQEYYAADFFVDFDKFVNYNQYYWTALGPETVTLSAPATAQAFNVDREIVGQQTYATNEQQLQSPETWQQSVKFSNGMRIQFIGNIRPASYRGREFYVEGVGTAEGIRLLPVDNFVIPEIYNYPVTVKREAIPWDIYPWDTTAWDGSRLVPGSDTDYVTINRASRDLNPWTRSNRWFHIDVLRYSAEINGNVLISDDTFRGKRPILEFRPDIKLIRFGTQGLEPISLIDYTVTSAFTQVAGQLEYTIDGIELFAGMKVIFAADENPDVARQVYLVQQITPVTGGEAVLYLEPIVGQVAEEGSVTVCTLGASQQGYSFFYSNGQWSTIQQTQQKTHPNQAPLFDVYDNNGVSFSNSVIYPQTTFVGSPLFQYAVGTGVADVVLRFPLQYSSVGNIGDILFYFNLYRDSFTYLNGLVTDTVGLRTGYVHQYTTRVTYERLIGYQTASLTPNTTDVPLLSQQPQILEYNYTSGSIIVDVAVWQQDQYPDITNIVRVSVNDVLQDPNTYQYRILDGNNLEVYPDPAPGAGTGVQTEITFTVNPAPTSLVVVAVLSDQVSKLGYFAVPTNLSVNALNRDLTECTLGTVRDHYVSICQNIAGFQGQVLAANNSRDLGNLIPYGTNLIQHSAALAIPAVFLREQDYAVTSAVDYSSAEYQRYKDLLLDYIWKNEFLTETTAEILDSAIDALKANRSSDSPFYWSDIITAGIFEATNYTWYEETSTTFDLIYTYNYSAANYQGLNVYVDNVILCRDRDYVINTDTNTVTLAESTLTDGATVTIREYRQTYGNFVPATPSSLRLYPAYFPEIYTDSTYSTPTVVIRGHDGSITPAFGDYRDQVLLEFETRIYSNIKGAADYPLDYNEFLPGAFRGVTEDNINSQTILNNDFVRWLGANRVDYKQQDYQAANANTWNYGQSGAKIAYPAGQQQGQTIPLPGYWRQVYWFFYDTDEPQNYPWQMLGFTNQPIWWETTYGPAPYTSGNQYMWRDIAAGRIREPGNEYINAVYARPGLLDVLPVDAQGNLLNPFESVVADYNPATWQANWTISGGSPAASAWRKSSAWPFAIQKLLLLLRPAQYLSYYIDRDLYRFNQEFQQWLYNNRQRLTSGDLQIYGTGTAVNSYVNFIVDYNKSYGFPGTENLQARLNNVDVRLAYRVAGFTDKRYLQLLSDRSSPNSRNRSLLIPDENYNILLYRNEIFDSINFSAVTIERVESGWAVYGNSLANPYFQILPSVTNNNYTTVSIGGTTIRMQRDFTNNVVLIPYGYIFRSVNAVVDFLLSYGEFLSRSGFSYSTVENTVLLNWPQMAQEFVYWQNQGWSVGSLIQLNPGANRMQFFREDSVVANLLDAKREDILVNQNKQALHIRDYTVYRDANEFELTTLNENTIGYVNLKLTSYEHIIILDNVTDFGDVVYEELTGLRQGRLIYQGIKSAAWNGTLDAPGFLINLPSVTDWDSGLKYAKGQVVKFKNFYYQANTTVNPSDTFDYNYWNKITYRPDQEGMLPNLALKAVQSTQFYDQHATNLDADAELLGFGITGFRPREYMASIDLSIVSQMNAYQDFIGTKGTPRSLYYYDQAEVGGDELSYDIYENWALQRATYGATATNAFVDFTLDAAVLTSNPSTSQFVELGQTTEADQATLITELYATSYPVKSTEILPPWTQNNPDINLPTAGYVDSRDVDIQLFSITDLSDLDAELDKVTNLAEIWVAKVNEAEWTVYKCQNIQATLVLAQDNLDGQTLLVFDVNHNLVADQVIIIKEFNTDLQGAFLVNSVPNATTVLIENSLPDGVTSLIGSGIVFQLLTVRVAQASDIAGLPVEYQLVNTNRVWVDNNGFGQWETLEKQNPYANVQSYEYASTVNYGAAVCQTSDNGNILIGAPGSYTSGAVIPYESAGNTYTAETPVTVPSTWTDYTDFGRVGDASGPEWAAFSVGIATAGLITDFRVVLMQKNARGFEPRQLLPGGTTGTVGVYSGQIKFSEDYNWLYVSNPVARSVQVYQRNSFQDQRVAYPADGRTISFVFSDSVRVVNGQQISVYVNSTLQSYLFDYTANSQRLTLRTPPLPPATLTVAEITLGSTTMVLPSTTNIAVGQTLSGIGIAADTEITAVDTATNTITLSTAVTATATNVGITFTNMIYVSRWDRDPGAAFWGAATNPLVPNGTGRIFPISMLAGATPDAGSVGVYYNGQLMRPNNSPAVDGDYIYDFPNQQVVFNFVPPRTTAQAITYQCRDYYSALPDIVKDTGDTFGISCATSGDGSVLLVGDADANTSDISADHDGTAYVYSRGTVSHQVANTSVLLYSTPVDIVGYPQVQLNGQLLTEDTDTNFGSYVFEPEDSVLSTGPAAVRFNEGVIGNVGDIVTISYNTFNITQILANPQANAVSSEFGGAVSVSSTGASVIIGAPNGNTAVLNSGFAARIEDQALVYGSLTGNVSNPTVAIGSGLRINGYYIEFDSANISNITLANSCQITTATAHGYYTGETVVMQDLNGGVLNLSNNPYEIKVTGPTTFNIFEAGSITNVTASSMVVVTSSITANIGQYQLYDVFNAVEISGVQGIANVNNTPANPTWLARRANGNSVTQFEIMRGENIINIEDSTDVETLADGVALVLISGTTATVRNGQPVVLESYSAPQLDNRTFYVGNVGIYQYGDGSSAAGFVPYLDPTLSMPLSAAGNTGPGGTVGIYINGTGWGNYAGGGHALRYINTTGLLPYYNPDFTQGTVFDGSLDGVVNVINDQNIPNLQAANAAGKLQLQVIDTTASLPEQRLSVLPGVEDTYENSALVQLGLYPYYTAGAQIIHGSYATFGARFGYRIDQDWITDQVVISSEFGTAAPETTFDDDTTTFDSRSTRFVEQYLKAGSVDVYDLLLSANATRDNASQLVWDRQLVDSLVRPNQLFGSAVSILGDNIIVGSPDYSVDNIPQGRALVFSGRRTGWKTIQQQPQQVDVHLLNEVTIYNKASKVTLNYLDFIDPLQGRVLGVAQQNIDLISPTDPAGYNNGDVNNYGVNWGEAQYGYIWWDTTNARFLECHLQDINQAARIWGTTFPGSSIDIYQWIESDVAPADYNGLGTPRSVTEYSSYTVVTDTNAIVQKYYFWVSGLTGVLPYTNKTLGLQALVQYISNPRSSGISYLAAINPSTVAIYNSGTDFVADENVLHISYDQVPQDNNIHVEYDLIQQDNPRQFLDDTSYAKFVDSFSGIDAAGNAVPDPNLPPGLLYGINFNPRQSMFRDRFLALKNYITSTNEILLTFPFTEESSLDFLNSQEEPPLPGELDSDLQPWWNVQVANLTELSYNNIDLVPLGWRYLVLQDSLYNNFWAIYQVVADAAGARTTQVIRVQTYKTPQYWSYVNWYAEGFDPLQRPLYTVEYLSQAQVLPLPENGVVRVTNNNPLGYELYQNKVIESYRDPATLQWVTVTEFTRVGLENGTVQISNLIYDYTDLVNPNQRPQLETRKIIDSINYEILVNERLILRNQLMSLMFDFILGEQIDCNWLYKTSLIDITHPVRKLLPYRTYKRDNQEFVYGYVEEVKPYHVLIKDFSLVYATVADVYPGDITDFDVPATFNVAEGRYISPILENNPAYPDYNQYGIYGVGPYAQFKGYISATNSQAQTILTVTESLKGSIYIGAILTGTGLRPATEILSTFPDDAQGQTRYLVSGEYENSTATITMEINPIWATLPYRNWYSNFGLYIKEIQVVNAGAGYTTTPTVTISGVATDTARATATLNGRGGVAAIEITYLGGRYQGQPTVTISAPDTEPGTQATAYVVTGPGPVRNFDATIVYNRMNLRPTFTEWISGYVYYQGDQVKFGGSVWSSKFDYNQNTQFNFSDWTYVPPEALEGVDRTYGYYQGAPGQPGLDLDQLISGLTYPGVVINRRYLGTFDTGAWDSAPLESDRDRLQTILAGGEYPIDSSTGILPEMAAWDVSVTGGEYINRYASHAPEELVPGITYDTMDMTVRTIPGQDNTGAGFSSPLKGRVIAGDGVTSTFSFDGLIKYPESVLVFKRLATGEQIELILDTDQTIVSGEYSIDWPNLTVTLATGTVTYLELGNSGEGYNNAPTISFTSTTGGSGAVATANVANGSITGLTLISGGSGYSTDLVQVIITPTGGDVPSNNATAVARATAVLPTEKIMIVAVGLGGGNQILRYSRYYADGIPDNGNIIVPVQYDSIWELPVFVNGTALSYGNNYTISAYRPEPPTPDANDIFPYTKIDFIGDVPGNSRVDYTVLGYRLGTTTYDGYSLPQQQILRLSSPSGTFTLNNSIAGTNPIAAVVNWQGERLRGPHCVAYIADGEQTVFAAGWQRDVQPEFLTNLDITVYVDDQPVAASGSWESSYTEITDTYDIEFYQALPSGSRVVIAVWAASQYTFDQNVGNIIYNLGNVSVANTSLQITTWGTTAEQNFLNTVTLGQTIIPVNQDLAVTTNARWENGASVITVGVETQGHWNNQGLWFDYAAYGSGIDLGNLNPDGTQNPANTAVPSEMLSYGNVIVVTNANGQYINPGDLASGAGVPEGVVVTQVKHFKNRDLQDNWAVAIDRQLPGNGLIWNRQYSNVGLPRIQSNIYGISDGPNIVAVDDYNNILMTNNGGDWTYIDPVALLPLRAVAYGTIFGTGTYVAVGLESNILRSSDGINWTQEGFALPLDTYAFRAVAYGAGRFVVVGDDGVIFYSTDTITWTQATTGTTENFSSVAYDGTTFIAVANDGFMLASTSGSLWVRRYLGYVSDVTVTNGGSEYQQPPTVAFEGPFNGTGITTRGYAAIEGGIGSATVANAGVLYARAPNITITQPGIGTFSGGTPSGATANSGLNPTGVVTYLGLVNSGAGYNNSPTISFTSTTGGSGATANATLGAGGSITGLTLISGGSGYSTDLNDIQVTITPTGGDVPSSNATAVATVTGTVQAVFIDTVGANYSSYDTIAQANSSPTFTVTPYFTRGTSNILVTTTVGASVVSLQAVGPDAGNISLLQTGMRIVFTDNSNVDVYTGNITSVYIGNNSIQVSPLVYANINAAIQFNATDQGQNAQVVMNEYSNASVTGVIITERGSGYESAPTVTIGFPPSGIDQATANSTLANVTTDNLQAVNYVANTWIAVGQMGIAIRSNNNITWFEGNVGQNTSLTTVFGSRSGNANVFLTGGVNGNLFISSNVANGWQPITSGITANIAQGASGNGQYAIVAEGGVIIYSTTGQSNTWVPATTSTNTAQDLWGVTFSGNASNDWCAVGTRSTILRTSNVAQWQAYNQEWPLNDSAYGLQAGTPTYVLVGDNGTVYRSLNNSQEYVRIDASTDLDIEAVAYGNSKFVAVGQNSVTVVASSNANTWVTGSIGVADTFRDIYFANAAVGNRFIAVGDNGQVWRTADGISWEKLSVPTTANLRCVISLSVGGATKTIIGGENGTLLTSVNDSGNVFSLVTQGGTQSFFNTIANNRTFVTTSSTIRATDTTDISVTINGNAAVQGIDYIVTGLSPNVSIQTVNAVPTGTTIVITTTMPNWNAIAYGSNKFVIQGQDGTTWNGANNGADWTQMQSMTSANIMGLIYSDTIDRFISVGEIAGSQQIGTQGYIALSATADYYSLTFAPDFKRILPGMLVTGDYVRTNTLVTGTDYAQRLVYVDAEQRGLHENIQVTFTPTQIENVYPTQDPVAIDPWRPWVTVSGNRQFYAQDYVADGSAVRIVGADIPATTVVQMLDSSQNSVPNELDFKLWKDMNDYTAVYRMTEFNVTETAEQVLPTDDIIYVADASRLSLPQLDRNMLGVVFVGSERIAYRYIDYTNNTISGLLRGVGGSAVQTHAMATEVVDASDPNIIPIAYRDQIQAQRFIGDGSTKSFATYTLMADTASEVQVMVGGTEIATRLATVSATGTDTQFVANMTDVTGNVTGTIIVQRPDQVLVAVNDSLLSQPTSNIYFGDDSTNVFVANAVTVSNVANVIVTINNQVVEPTAITLTDGHPNVVINPAPNSNSLVQITSTYAVTAVNPVTVAFAQAPQADALITLAADFYATSVEPVAVTFAQAPANTLAVIVGIDTSRSYYNEIGDGIRLQSQPTLAGRFLQGDV